MVVGIDTELILFLDGTVALVIHVVVVIWLSFAFRSICDLLWTHLDRSFNGVLI